MLKTWNVGQDVTHIRRWIELLQGCGPVLNRFFALGILHKTRNVRQDVNHIRRWIDILQGRILYQKKAPPSDGATILSKHQ